jgi:hypothetical protein
MKCVIIGTGISGQVASMVLRRFGHDVIAIGPDSGDFFKGGLKYLHWSRHLYAAVVHYKIGHDFEQIQGGIFWKGKIHPYPEFMNRVRDRAETIQRLHYEKTRGATEGWTAKCMNDPGKDHSKSLVIKPADLTRAAFAGIDVCTAMVDSVDLAGHTIRTKFDNFHFDVLFTSIHATAFGRLAGLDFPELRNGHIGLYQVDYSEPPTWTGPDYIYTPAQKMVSRISHDKSTKHFCAEVPQPFGTNDFDATSIVKDEVSHVLGREIGISKQGRIKGHIIEAGTGPEYPDCVIPIGRYASWNSRETADVVAEKVGGWCDGI